MDSYSGNNSLGVNLEILSTETAAGLDLLQDVLLNPTFPVPALEREKEIQLAAIESQKDNLLQSTFRSVKRLMFGEKGYGLDALGTRESVSSLTQSTIAGTHSRLVTPSNGVLALFGDLNPAAIIEDLETRLSTWHSAAEAAEAMKASTSTAVQGGGRSTTHRDKKQAVLVIGFPGTTLHDPRRYALDVIQEACSDLGSRLFSRIREKLGLAYYVGAQNFTGLGTGFFSFYAGTHPDRASLVESEIMEEVRALRESGLTPDELARSKAKIIGHKKIAHQNLGSLASAVALDELFGLGFRHVDEEEALYESLTLEQIRECARAFLTPENAIVGTTCPSPESQETVAK